MCWLFAAARLVVFQTHGGGLVQWHRCQVKHFSSRLDPCQAQPVQDEKVQVVGLFVDVPEKLAAVFTDSSLIILEIMPVVAILKEPCRCVFSVTGRHRRNHNRASLSTTILRQLPLSP